MSVLDRHLRPTGIIEVVPKQPDNLAAGHWPQCCGSSVSHPVSRAARSSSVGELMHCLQVPVRTVVDEHEVMHSHRAHLLSRLAAQSRRVLPSHGTGQELLIYWNTVIITIGSLTSSAEGPKDPWRVGPWSPSSSLQYTPTKVTKGLRAMGPWALRRRVLERRPELAENVERVRRLRALIAGN